MQNKEQELPQEKQIPPKRVPESETPDFESQKLYELIKQDDEDSTDRMGVIVGLFPELLKEPYVVPDAPEMGAMNWLMIACSHRNVGAVEMFLKILGRGHVSAITKLSRVDVVNETDGKGNTPAMHAVRGDLYKKSVDGEKKEERDEKACTKEQDKKTHKILESLLAVGVNLDLANQEHETAFGMARTEYIINSDKFEKIANADSEYTMECNAKLPLMDDIVRAHPIPRPKALCPELQRQVESDFARIMYDMITKKMAKNIEPGTTLPPVFCDNEEGALNILGIGSGMSDIDMTEIVTS